MSKRVAASALQCEADAAQVKRNKVNASPEFKLPPELQQYYEQGIKPKPRAIEKSPTARDYWRRMDAQFGDELECIVCRELLIDAVSFNCCGASCCVYCVDSVVKQRCPKCRTAWRERGEAVRPNYALSALLSFYYGAETVEAERSERAARLAEAKRRKELGRRYLNSQRYARIAGIVALCVERLCSAGALPFCALDELYAAARKELEELSCVASVAREEIALAIEYAMDDDTYERRGAHVFKLSRDLLTPLAAESGGIELARMQSFMASAILAACDDTDSNYYRRLAKAFLQHNGAEQAVVDDFALPTADSIPHADALQRAIDIVLQGKLGDAELAPDDDASESESDVSTC